MKCLSSSFKFLVSSFLVLLFAFCAQADQWVIDGQRQLEAVDPQTAINTAAIIDEQTGRVSGDEAIHTMLDRGISRVQNGIIPPANPAVGDLWCDTSSGTVLKIYAGFWRVIPWLLQFAYTDGTVRNADKLDGLDHTYFLPRSSSISFTAGYATLSGAYLNGYLDVVNKAYLKNGLDLWGSLNLVTHSASIWFSGQGSIFMDSYNKAGNTNNSIFGSFSSHSVLKNNRIALVACQDSDIQDCNNTFAAGYAQTIKNADGCFIGGAENSITNVADCLIHTKLSTITNCAKSVFLGGTNIVAGNVTNSIVMGRNFTITNLDGVFYLKGLHVLLNLPTGTTAPAEIPAGAMWVDSDDEYTVKVKQ